MACAIFISLITDKIPNKSKFCVEKYKNIPLIFIGLNNEEKNLENTVSSRIMELHMLFESLKNKNCNEIEENIEMDRY